MNRSTLLRSTWLAFLALLPCLPCPCPAQLSSNKVLTLGANNVLRPTETNFFDTNFVALTNALTLGGFTSGGGNNYTANFDTNGGKIDLATTIAPTNLSVAGWQIVTGSQTNSNTFRIYQGNLVDIFDLAGTGGATASMDHLCNLTISGNYLGADFRDNQGFSTDGLGDVNAKIITASSNSVTALTNTAGVFIGTNQGNASAFAGNAVGLTNLPFAAPNAMTPATSISAQTFYWIGAGASSSSGSATNLGWVAPIPCIITNFYANCDVAYGAGTNMTNIIYKNGAATGMICVYGSGATQQASDTTHSFTMAAGDRLSFTAEYGATSGVNTTMIISMTALAVH